MTLQNDHDSKSQTSSNFPSRIKKVAQPLRLILSAFAILMLIALVKNWTRAYLPGASTNLYWVAVAILVIAALLNIPRIFQFIPQRLKLSSWVSILVAPIVFIAATENMQAAFSRSPAGQEAARLETIEANREDLARAEAARLAGEAADRVAAGLPPINPQQANQESSSASQVRAERCVSRARRPLADTVKASLQNPRSFEFVDITLATVTGSQAVVFMTFRGENGFGAIRTEAVRAVIGTTDCSITEIADTQSE